MFWILDCATGVFTLNLIIIFSTPSTIPSLKMLSKIVLVPSLSKDKLVADVVKSLLIVAVEPEKSKLMVWGEVMFTPVTLTSIVLKTAHPCVAVCSLTTETLADSKKSWFGSGAINSFPTLTAYQAFVTCFTSLENVPYSCPATSILASLISWKVAFGVSSTSALKVICSAIRKPKPLTL